jgi:hypothetical protein
LIDVSTRFLTKAEAGPSSAWVGGLAQDSRELEVARRVSAAAPTKVEEVSTR